MLQLLDTVFCKVVAHSCCFVWSLFRVCYDELKLEHLIIFHFNFSVIMVTARFILLSF